MTNLSQPRFGRQRKRIRFLAGELRVVDFGDEPHSGLGDRTGDEAAHADGNIVGDPKRVIPAAIIEDRARADEDTVPDVDMAGKAGAGADLGIIADSIIVADDAVGVNNTALAQSGIRADVGEGTNERSLAEESAITDDGTRRDDSGKVQLRVILMESAPVAIVADRDDTVPFAESGWIKIGLPEGLESAHC